LSLLEVELKYISPFAGLAGSEARGAKFTCPFFLILIRSLLAELNPFVPNIISLRLPVESVAITRFPFFQEPLGADPNK
jgi:hypothetical protein